MWRHGSKYLRRRSQEITWAKCLIYIFFLNFEGEYLYNTTVVSLIRRWGYKSILPQNQKPCWICLSRNPGFRVPRLASTNNGRQSVATNRHTECTISVATNRCHFALVQRLYTPHSRKYTTRLTIVTPVKYLWYSTEDYLIGAVHFR